MPNCTSGFPTLPIGRRSGAGLPNCAFRPVEFSHRHDLLKDALAYSRAQRFTHDETHLDAKSVGELIPELHERKKGRRLPEADENIQVTVRAAAALDYGAEYGKLLDLKSGFQLGLGLSERINDLVYTAVFVHSTGHTGARPTVAAATQLWLRFTLCGNGAS